MPGPTPTTLRRLLDLQRRACEGRFSTDLLDQAVDCAVGLTNADRGFIVVPKENEKLEIRCARGNDRTTLRTADRVVSTTLCREVLETKRRILLVDPLDLPRFKDAQSLGVLKLRSIILVPLQAHGVVQGAVVLHEQGRAERFSDEDGQLAELVAEPAAHALETLLEDHAVEKHVSTKRLKKDQVERYPRLVGRSEVMKTFREKLGVVCDSDATVLIHGETGTGKELVARTIHEAGKRKKGPFLALNVGALTESLAESELFGHEKGAFTGAEATKPGCFERAEGGVLLLDEIGELSLATQVKLLRVLQEREVQRVGGTKSIKVNVRVVAATHRSLEQLVKAGKFREDLLYRLKVVTIETPPLRRHLEDLPALCDHLLMAIASSEEKKIPTLHDEVVKAFQQHSWPGNVRELATLMYRAVVSQKPVVRLEHLDFAPDGPAEPAETSSPREMFERADRERALAVLRECGGNVSLAAKKLGIARSTFYDRYGRVG